MIGLCIAESYYMLGVFRIEHFRTMEHLEKFRAGLDQSVTTWLITEPMPKRKTNVGREA